MAHRSKYNLEYLSESPEEYKNRFQERLSKFLVENEIQDSSMFLNNELEVWNRVLYTVGAKTIGKKDVFRAGAYIMSQISGQITDGRLSYEKIKFQSLEKIKFLKEKQFVILNGRSNEPPKFNTNYFNENCFSLYEYLIHEYQKKGNVKYINIYYFLKSFAKNPNEQYRFTIKINEYRVLIKEQYSISITKFQKAKYDYEDNELPKLKELEAKFKKQ